MKVGIAIVPCIEMIESIIEFQQTVVSFCPLRPQLGTDVNLPHITLLQGRFRECTDWINLIAKLRVYCLEQKYSLEISLTQLEYKVPDWCFLLLNHNKIFNEAHKFVFEHLKESLFLTEEDLQKDISDYTFLERFNYLNYGYRYIGEAFHPHITLGRIIDSSWTLNEANLNYLFQLLLISKVGRLQKITVYEIGENGSHTTTLHSVEF